MGFHMTFPNVFSVSYSHPVLPLLPYYPIPMPHLTINSVGHNEDMRIGGGLVGKEKGFD